ncbi:hypothetical protein [Colwellia sp. MEBiC06753]
MSEKSPLDDNWQTLVDDWQSQPYQAQDIDKLVKQLSHRTLMAKVILAFDILATLFLLGCLVYQLKTDPDDTATLVFLAVGGLGSLVYTILEFRIRIRTWQLDASDPQQAFEKSISGIKGAIHYANLWIYTSYLMYPLVNWYIWELGKTATKPILPAYIMANALVTVMVIGGVIFKRRRAVELNRMTK